eukprot:6181555-Pleurochrysis_carterae.AAC.4
MEILSVHKKARNTCDSQSCTESAQPQCFPPVAALYENGLLSRAEATTASSSWHVDARDWRTDFSRVDDGTRLRQRQAEMRRILLASRGQPSRTEASADENNVCPPQR